MQSNVEKDLLMVFWSRSEVVFAKAREKEQTLNMSMTGKDVVYSLVL